VKRTLSIAVCIGLALQSAASAAVAPTRAAASGARTAVLPAPSLETPSLSFPSISLEAPVLSVSAPAAEAAISPIVAQERVLESQAALGPAEPARAPREARAELAGLGEEISRAQEAPRASPAPALDRFWSGAAPRAASSPVAAFAAVEAGPSGGLEPGAAPGAEAPAPPPPDPWEPHPTMPAGRWLRGKNAGKPVDTSTRRPLRILRGAEAAPYSPKEGEIVAAGFSHGDKFFVAKFPKDAVQDVIFQKWDFGEKRLRLKLGPWVLFDHEILHVAHTEVRFKLKPGSPVLLYPQAAPEPGRAPEPVASVDDLVTSVEAVGIPGETFNIAGGLLNHFVAVRRFKSLRQSFQDRVVREGRLVQQWLLAVDESAKQRLLAKAMHLSDEEGYGAPYHLFLHSCTTEAFKLIDLALPLSHYWAHALRRIPMFPEAYLWARGLLYPRGRSRLSTLNDEKRDWRTNS
jgi:hypothetical protein